MFTHPTDPALDVLSAGVQSVVAERYPGTIFCAVETSGDGAVNFYSRVQMFLFKAQKNAEQEFQSALEDTGLTEQQVRDYIAKTPKFRDTLYFAKQRKVVACKAARTAKVVARELGEEALQQLGRKVPLSKLPLVGPKIAARIHA